MFPHVLAEDNDFLHNGLVDLGDGDFVFSATVFNEAVDEDRLLGCLDVNLDNFSVFAKKSASFSHGFYFLRYNYNNIYSNLLLLSKRANLSNHL